MTFHYFTPETGYPPISRKIGFLKRLRRWAIPIFLAGMLAVGAVAGNAEDLQVVDIDAEEDAQLCAV